MPELNTEGTTPVVETPPVNETEGTAISQTPQVPPQYSGKSPEDLVRILEEKEKMIGKQSAEVGELRKKVAGFQEYVETIQPPAPKHQSEELPDSSKFWDDPIAATNAIIERRLQEAMKPITNSTVGLSKTAFRQSLGGADAALFDKYEAEYNQLLNSVPEATRSDPALMKEVYHQVRGRHTDEYIDLRQAHAAPPEPPPIETPSGTRGVPKVRLTTEQKQAAQAFNMTEEDYSEWVAKTNIITR